MTNFREQSSAANTMRSVLFERGAEGLFCACIERDSEKFEKISMPTVRNEEAVVRGLSHLVVRQFSSGMRCLSRREEHTRYVQTGPLAIRKLSFRVDLN